MSAATNPASRSATPTPAPSRDAGAARRSHTSPSIQAPGPEPGCGRETRDGACRGVRSPSVRVRVVRVRVVRVRVVRVRVRKSLGRRRARAGRAEGGGRRARSAATPTPDRQGHDGGDAGPAEGRALGLRRLRSTEHRRFQRRSTKQLGVHSHFSCFGTDVISAAEQSRAARRPRRIRDQRARASVVQWNAAPPWRHAVGFLDVLEDRVGDEQADVTVFVEATATSIGVRPTLGTARLGRSGRRHGSCTGVTRCPRGARPDRCRGNRATRMTVRRTSWPSRSAVSLGPRLQALGVTSITTSPPRTAAFDTGRDVSDERSPACGDGRREENVEEFGLTYFGMDDRRQGECTSSAEQGFDAPRHQCVCGVSRPPTAPLRVGCLRHRHVRGGARPRRDVRPSSSPPARTCVSPSRASSPRESPARAVGTFTSRRRRGTRASPGSATAARGSRAMVRSWIGLVGRLRHRGWRPRRDRPRRGHVRVAQGSPRAVPKGGEYDGTSCGVLEVARDAISVTRRCCSGRARLVVTSTWSTSLRLHVVSITGVVPDPADFDERRAKAMRRSLERADDPGTSMAAWQGGQGVRWVVVRDEDVRADGGGQVAPPPDVTTDGGARFRDRRTRPRGVGLRHRRRSRRFHSATSPAASMCLAHHDELLPLRAAPPRSSPQLRGDSPR